MLTVHGPTLHPSPLQPEKVDPASGVAVRMTKVPWKKAALQATPQLIPIGFEVTVPLPVPAFVIVKVKVCALGLRVNVAVTLRACVMLTVHVPVPLHPSPLQPEKVDPASGVAVKVTLVPWAKAVLQTPPQLIPTGFEVAVPLPVPAFVTVKVKVCALGLRVNVAVTLRACIMLTVHVPVPLHPSPLQPSKVNPTTSGYVAIRMTLVPWAKAALQVLSQVIPAGFEITVPLPVPAFITVKVKGLLTITPLGVVVFTTTIAVDVPIPINWVPDKTEMDIL